MVSEIRIYYEGSRSLSPGFKAFFRELRTRAAAIRCRLEVISAGSGGTACNDFGTALKTHTDAWNILLRDSEGPCTENSSALLCREQGWHTSHAASIFWMVEMMESWFHADKDTLTEYYGPRFKPNALKPNPNVEQIAKADLIRGLKAATRDTAKGDYFDNKTSHGPRLLELIDPERVRKSAPNCQRLFEAVLTNLNSTE